MSTDSLTGLPIEFVHMLAIKVDPYADNPTKPLDDFFAALKRAQNFRPTRKAAGNDLGRDPAQGGPFIMTTATQETQSALTVVKDNLPTIGDGWDAAANDSSASPAKGAGIKFDGGAYFIGREKTLVAPDRQFVAIDVREGWLFLKKDCPAEYSMRTVGGPKPPRPDSFTDVNTWPDGLDGEPSDPWRYAKFLYLLDPVSAEIFTFTSSTTGGRIGLSDLADQIQLMRRTRPGAVPIVELQSRQMKTKFGMKPRPFFQVISWRVKSDEAQKLIADNTGDQNDGTKTINDMDDEIPF